MPEQTTTELTEELRVPDSVTLWLMRHGECEGQNCLRGWSDFPLTAAGLKQMKSQARELRVDLVLSSDLRRCADFADWFSESHNVPLEFDQRWREMNFGRWDGLSTTELWQDHPAEMERFYEDPRSNALPESESLEQFEARLKAAMDDLLDQRLGQNVLLVTHSGVIRQLLLIWLGIEQRSQQPLFMKIKFASVIEIQFHKLESGSWLPVWSI